MRLGGAIDFIDYDSFLKLRIKQSAPARIQTFIANLTSKYHVAITSS